MTREIMKFRAWDRVNQKFTYWTMNDLCTWAEKDEKPSPFDEWQQSTRLLDKNGKEIYVGDIFGVYSSTGDFAGIHEPTGKVILDIDLGAFTIEQTNGGWEYIAKYIYNPKFQVIGNIYQNPDLLANIKI